MNNSQFWSWVDHWEGWDFMSDEQEDKMLLEDWDEELFCELDPCISERDLRIIMICMECGNSLDCCICEEPSAPLPASLILSIPRFLGALDPDWHPGRPSRIQAGPEDFT